MNPPAPFADTYYNRLEIDLMFREQNHLLKTNHTEIQELLKRIETQTIKHNGRLSKLETRFLIVACVVATLLATNSPQILSLLKTFL